MNKLLFILGCSALFSFSQTVSAYSLESCMTMARNDIQSCFNRAREQHKAGNFGYANTWVRNAAYVCSRGWSHRSISKAMDIQIKHVGGRDPCHAIFFHK